MQKEQGREMAGEITLRASGPAIGKAVAFVSAHCREMAFTDGRIDEVGSALIEALGNIIRFACPTGAEEITITCASHETGALVVNIIDSGRPFNMLVMSTFPEVAQGGEIPSTRVMKRAIRDVEYRRDGGGRRNVLAWVVSR